MLPSAISGSIPKMGRKACFGVMNPDTASKCATPVHPLALRSATIAKARKDPTALRVVAVEKTYQTYHAECAKEALEAPQQSIASEIRRVFPLLHALRQTESIEGKVAIVKGCAEVARLFKDQR
eukprot:gene25556-11204_t